MYETKSMLGSRLENGAVVWDHVVRGDGSHVYLAVWADTYMPYVTWLAPAWAPQKTYSGNYFDNKEQATLDFERRKGL